MINFEIPQKDKLIQFLKSDSRIMLVYVFGSQAKGNTGLLSDYDIAVLLSDIPSYTYKYELCNRITRILDATVDLVILNVAPVELKYAIIANGVLIHEKDKAIKVEFEGDTLGRYFDFLPVLRNQQEEILKGTKSETGIHRYREALRKTEKVLAEIRAVKDKK